MHPSFQAKLLTEHMDVLGRAKFLRVQVDYTTVVIAQQLYSPTQNQILVTSGKKYLCKVTKFKLASHSSILTTCYGSES